MYIVTTADKQVADMLTEAFAQSVDYGWSVVNNYGTWDGGAIWRPVRQELIRLGVLSECPCGNPNITFNEPVESCQCYVHTDDHQDDSPREIELCPGDCGQLANACTCAERESLRKHDANPATRGSTWVA